MVLWLRLHTSNAGGMGSISGWGTKIPHAMQYGQKIIIIIIIIFNLRTILDLQKNDIDSAESSHMPLTQFPLLLTSYGLYGPFVTINEPILIHYY